MPNPISEQDLKGQSVSPRNIIRPANETTTPVLEEKTFEPVLYRNPILRNTNSVYPSLTTLPAYPRSYETLSLSSPDGISRSLFDSTQSFSSSPFSDYISTSTENMVTIFMGQNGQHIYNITQFNSYNSNAAAYTANHFSRLSSNRNSQSFQDILSFFNNLYILTRLSSNLLTNSDSNENTSSNDNQLTIIPRRQTHSITRNRFSMFARDNSDIDFVTDAPLESVSQAFQMEDPARSISRMLHFTQRGYRFSPEIIDMMVLSFILIFTPNENWSAPSNSNISRGPG